MLLLTLQCLLGMVSKNRRLGSLREMVLCGNSVPQRYQARGYLPTTLESLKVNLQITCFTLFVLLNPCPLMFTW